MKTNTTTDNLRDMVNALEVDQLQPSQEKKAKTPSTASSQPSTWANRKTRIRRTTGGAA